ncbi:MAG TPA: class F sortase [Pedococcus sp.]|nr:class F sortase [Pedococcus sp.]
MTLTTGAVRRGLAAVLAVAGVGLASWAVADQQSPPQPSADRVVERGPALGTEPITRIKAVPPRRHPAAAPPQRVRVPSMGIDVPVVGIDVVGGVLTPPSDPQVLGWWREGAVPGALRGSALVTGHTVSVGGGALDDLEDVRLDAAVQVRTARGVIDYRATKVDIYRKASLAKEAQQVFSQTSRGRLVLITCEDWDGVRYNSNVVVYAEPVPAR